MKIPFHTVIRDLLAGNRQMMANFCSGSLFYLATPYVFLMGFFGTILCLFDMWRIIKCGPILPDFLYSQLLRIDIITESPRTARDYTLISLMLLTEYYFFLIIGLATNNAILYMPYLIAKGFVMLIEFLLFVKRTSEEGLILPKKTLLRCFVTIFNWSNVACTFAGSLTLCDI